jgi:hypothetical protein
MIRNILRIPFQTRTNILLLLLLATLFVNHTQAFTFTQSATCTAGSCGITCSGTFRDLTSSVSVSGVNYDFFTGGAHVRVPICGTASAGSYSSYGGDAYNTFNFGTYQSGTWKLGTLDGVAAFYVQYSGGSSCGGGNAAAAAYLVCDFSRTISSALITFSESPTCRCK